MCITYSKRSKHKDILCRKWVLEGKLVNTGGGKKIGIVRCTLKVISFRFRSLNSIANLKTMVTSIVVNNCSAYVLGLARG